MTTLHLRAANRNDAATLFEMRNHPSIVKLSRSGRAVSWPEHVAWFNTAVSDATRQRIFLISQNQEIVGVIRFERERDERVTTTSIYLLEPLCWPGTWLPCDR